MEDRQRSPSTSPEPDMVTFPADFPLEPSVYDWVELEDYDPPLLPADPDDSDDPDDPRHRNFDSLYPLDWLVADNIDDHGTGPGAPLPAAEEPAPLGRLLRRWQRAFRRDGGSGYVEYVPAWSDPDWDDARYVHAGAGAGGAAAADELARQYAKPGLLQTQRPALLAADAALAPTDAARRWGVYPYRRWENLRLDVVGGADAAALLASVGWSGVTPRVAAPPPEVPLTWPRPGPGGGGGGGGGGHAGMKTSATVEDLAVVRGRFEQTCRQRGEEASDERFWQLLESLAANTADLLSADMAGSLLVLLETTSRIEEREEYQRLLFGGNTSNDLVEKGAWTMGMDASADLAEPLHDLVTRDKWQRTEAKGTTEADPRVVYNISGKQGEYCANDQTFWAALQPALQLVSKVLHGQHPVTWAWADVRKLRPIADYKDIRPSHRTEGIDDDHRGRGVDRKWKFALWPDAPTTTDITEMTGVARQWDEFSRICETGFDTTPYVCGILGRSLEWAVSPTYRISGDDAHRNYGNTVCEPARTAADRPFVIRINLAADLMWPLLVDEYSPAERAAATLYVAVTMLHELSHGLVVARCQMLARGPAGGGPLWLRLNPAWEADLRGFNARHRVDILSLLQTFGMRMRYDDVVWQANQIFWPTDEVYFENEPRSEEGWATENQYFGAVLETLPSTVATTFLATDSFRFLADLSVIAAATGWATDPGAPDRFNLAAPLARDAYLKLFSQGWWVRDYQAYGPSALKLNMGLPLPGMMQFQHFTWDLVEHKYGAHVRQWLTKVWTRVKDESDSQILWRYLYYRTVVATEPQACEAMWFAEQRNWDEGDIGAWNDFMRATDRFTELDDAMWGAADFRTGVVNGHPDPPLYEFRRLLAAIRHVQAVLGREASYHQNITARYIMLEEGEAKATLFQLYATKIRTRITGLYMRIAQELIRMLDNLTGLGERFPNVQAWLCSDADIDRMWHADVGDLRAKVRHVMPHLEVVRDVFGDDAGRRRVGVGQLGAIPSGAAQNQAQRVRRLAMRQRGRLAAADPRRRCADEWLRVLRCGGRLRHPAPGTPEWLFVQALARRNAAIDAAVDAQWRAVRAQLPG